MATFGKKLQQARKDAGYKNQEEFANALNISKQMVAQIESDRTMPNLKTAYVIEDLVGISLSELRDDQEIIYTESIDLWKLPLYLEAFNSLLGAEGFKSSHIIGTVNHIRSAVAARYNPKMKLEIEYRKLDQV